MLGAVLVACVYGIGRIAANGRAGLLAAVLVAAYPPLVQLSRIYRPHSAVPAFAASSLLLLLLLLRNRRIATAWALGAALAAGILVHPTFAYAIVAPLFAGAVYAVLFQRPPRWPAGLAATPRWLVAKLRDRLVVAGLLPAALMVLAAAGWYAVAGGRLVATAGRFAGAGVVVPVGFFDVVPDFWWYARTAPHVLSNVLAVLAVVAAIGCLLRGGVAARVVALALFAGYAIQSLTWVRGWWYFAPLLPFAAAVSGIWLSTLRPPGLATAAAAGATTVAVFTFVAVTWGLPPWLRPLAAALGAPLDAVECRGGSRETALCSTPPRQAAWPTAQIVDAISRDAPDCARGERACRVFLAVDTAVGADTGAWPAIRPALFDYTRARDHPDASIAFIAVRVEGRCRRRAALESDYLVHFAPEPSGAAGCYALWSRFLGDPPRAFGSAHPDLGVFALPGGRTARLLRRARGLTDDEVRQVDDAWRAARDERRSVR